MRIVTWNVCDRFAHNLPHLLELKPDIAIVQEVRPQGLQDAELVDRSHWIGDVGLKGMAVIAFGDWTLAPAAELPDEKWLLPIVATRGDETVNLVATWIDSRYRDCAPPTLSAIDRLGLFLTERPVVMAGDFNQCIGLDKGKGVGRRFADVVRELSAVGIHSAWHRHTGEMHGLETQPTYFHTWKQDRPFHIDFAFVSDSIRLCGASIGTFEQYAKARLSDHAPVTIDLDLTAASHRSRATSP